MESKKVQNTNNMRGRQMMVDIIETKHDEDVDIQMTIAFTI